MVSYWLLAVEMLGRSLCCVDLGLINAQSAEY